MKPELQKDQVRKSYELIADDFSATRQRAWKDFSFLKEELPREGSLLDVGCGNGRLLDWLEEKGYLMDYSGVDFCTGLLKKAEEAHPQANFLLQDMSELELDQKFDVIVSVAAFHHLPSRALRKKTLKRIFHHLEDDGVFLFSVWNLWQTRYLSQHLQSWGKSLTSFFRHDARDLMIPFGKEKVPRYYHAFLPYELRSLLKNEAFEITRFESLGHNYWIAAKKKMAKAVSDPLFQKLPSPKAALHTSRPVVSSSQKT